MTALFVVAVALYLTAASAFVSQLLGRREGALRLGRLVLATALLAHLGFIAAQWILGMAPLADVRGALNLSGWLLGVGALLISVRSRFAVVGLIVAPVSVGLLIISRLTPAGAIVSSAKAASVLGRVHIALVAAGVAIFGIAAAVASIYLLQEAALRSKRVGAMYRRTPPLASLDDAGRHLILIGFPIFTLAVVTGIIWGTRLPSMGMRPEYGLAAITWTIFAGVILSRITVGWRGRRAALLTVAGFVVVMTVLLVYTGRKMLGG